MGGLRRKISMERIEKKEKRSLAFTKRRDGLYRKASELCLLFDARIAILATPPTSNSNVSFYSFGHSSVSDVVDAFLENRRPSDSNDCLSELSGCGMRSGGRGLGFWWEEEGFDMSENMEDLKDAIDEIQKLKNDVDLRLKAMKDRQDSCNDALREIEAFLDEPEQESDQSPFLAKEIQDFWVQCFSNNDAEDVYSNLGVSPSQTEKTSEDNDVILISDSEDESAKGDVILISDSEDESAKDDVFRNENWRNEAGAAIESGTGCKNRVEDPHLDDLLIDLIY
ncbi:PREDICTED: MADS-box protein SOC1-like [Tarenaya hassleriana]|uniref:MADS-box protein SOC1-like n=1 Tax=Tarenaya hassleriana TaxID=28532 RepID=UPI00053CA736|nr:PREDICTED: MADS-box protein SOC1-like [Tarenaya hassleriana]